jgi:hypothetical protein
MRHPNPALRIVVQSRHHATHPSESGMPAKFFTEVRHKLHADADPEQRLAFDQDRLLYCRQEAAARELFSAKPERPDAGQNEVAAGVRVTWLRYESSACANRLDRIYDRTDIAGPIVHDADCQG